MPPSPGQIRRALADVDAFSLRQRIDLVGSTANPTSADFAFETVFDAVPLLEIFRFTPRGPAADMTPENLVAVRFPLFTPPQSSHQMRVDGLPQDTQLRYRLTATSTVLQGDLAVVTGRFYTGRRSRVLFINEMRAWNDGDPAGSGEMVFQLAAYGLDPATLLASFRYPEDGEADIRDGSVVVLPFGSPVLTVNHAPDSITLFATGRVDLFATAPEGNVTHAWWDRSRPDDSAARWADLGGRFRGDVAAIRSGTDHIDLFALIEDGSIHRLPLAGDREGSSKGRWQPLGNKSAGPLAAERTEAGELILASIGERGVVALARLGDDPKAEARWESLGGREAVAVAIAPAARKGFAIVAVRSDRSVYARTWDGHLWSPADGWETLGQLDDLDPPVLAAPPEVPPTRGAAPTTSPATRPPRGAARRGDTDGGASRS
ncbi:hypothetical protein [Paludisphaera mucosa]|uniref:Uncharacterized protein n=1 Tax=Paludisphaera mucosa TaxID=3030827 RepID=A0ABT6FDV4_9BACT|nr:hypothetical protein [Paludisphaera mucosa]MDG3005681.1 hypothetical protein [Paludisphaera mucosa]